MQPCTVAKNGLEDLREITAQRRREHALLLKPIAEVRGFRGNGGGVWVDAQGNEYDRQGRSV